MRRHKLSPGILRIILLALLLAGCGPRRSTPTPTATPGLPPPLVTPFATTPAVTLPEVTEPVPGQTAIPTLAGAGTTPLAGDTAVTLASPPATGCPKPEGWITYTIQPGDTLEGLSGQTGATVDALLSGNCLSGNLIIAYETLYLPKRPPRQAAPQPPAVQPPAGQPPSGTGGNPPVSPDCSASLSCVLMGAALPIIPGGPGNPVSYVPCESFRSTPWVDIHLRVIPQLKQGNRIFLYACNFPNGGGLSAVAQSLATGEQFPLRVYAEHPIPYLSKGKAVGVIDFPARPDWPLGGYNVTVSIGSESASMVSPIEIVETDALQPWILPDPIVASPGDTINIYYVNFPLAVTLGITMYSAGVPDYKDAYDGLIPRLTWTVPISNPLAVTGTPPAVPAGWGMAPFTFPPEALMSPYAVIDENHRGLSMIWLK